MKLNYTVKYSATNVYNTLVTSALWQFLIHPENNETQEVTNFKFHNSQNAYIDYSINGLGFKTMRLSLKKPFREITFDAEFDLTKQLINPFEVEKQDRNEELSIVNSTEFRANHEPYLRTTPLANISKTSNTFFIFNDSESTFDQLQKLNNWVYEYINFTTNITTVTTKASEIITLKKGVCQDFAHLFCSLSRANNIPTRYVSGYLHQGFGYFGDSQLHAWAECYIPNIGWVGFDPTNNLLTNQDHLKICHGKDYVDCSPLKGIIYASPSGENSTIHSVQVRAQQ